MPYLRAYRADFCAGAVLLWLPRRQAIGASLLGGTMVGAVLTHLLIIGPSMLPAIVLGLLCTAVLYLHRDQVAALLERSSSLRQETN